MDQFPVWNWVAIAKPMPEREVPAGRVLSLPVERCTPPGEWASQLVAGRHPALARKGWTVQRRTG